MQLYLEAQGDEIWSVVKNGTFIPTIVINNLEQPKYKILGMMPTRRKCCMIRRKKYTCICFRN